MLQEYEDFFPYAEFKPLQINAMDFVSETIEKKAVGVVEAYCGFGKTIATFAPVLAKGKKVLLLTPNYTARNAAAAEALKINKINGKKIRIADLRAKQFMCARFLKEKFSHEACQNSVKFKEDCKYHSNTFVSKSGKNLTKKALGIIESIQRDVTERPEKFFGNGLIEKEPHFFQSVQKKCDENELCSYEVMKKIASEADVLILDYFWCFTRIFTVLESLIDPKEFVLLVDEADMLIDRLYSDFQNQLSIVGLQKLFGQAEKLVAKQQLQETDLNFLEEFIKYTEKFLLENSPEKAILPNEIISFYTENFKKTAIKQGLEGTINFEIITENLSMIVETIIGSEEFEKASARPDAFLNHLDRIKNLPQYLSFIPKQKNRISVKPFEINNIILANNMTLLQTLQEFHSALLFSATIGDSELFIKELGLKKEETIFFKTEHMPHKKLLVLLDSELNTTFTAREKNFSKYIEKINSILAIDNSLLISCCNNFEAEKILKQIPNAENAELVENLEKDKTYVLNIRTKHARSTNKARHVRNCIVVGLPLPDYSDFFFQQRKKYLEAKYGKTEAGKLMNRKAIHTAIQLMGRITRNLSSPKAIVLADSRYKNDFFLGDFYFNTIPDYIKPFLKTVKNTQELKKEIQEFWEK